MQKFFTEQLKLSQKRTKWLHNATKQQFIDEIHEVRLISCLADTLLILHFCGRGVNNCTAEAWFGDELVGIQEAVQHASIYSPNLWVLLVFEADQEYDAEKGGVCQYTYAEPTQQNYKTIMVLPSMPGATIPPQSSTLAEKVVEHLSRRLDDGKGVLRLPEDLLYFAASSGAYLQSSLSEPIDILAWKSKWDKEPKKAPIVPTIQYKITRPTMRLYEGIRAGEKPPLKRDQCFPLPVDMDFNRHVIGVREHSS